MIASTIVDVGIFAVLVGLSFAIVMVARVAKTVKATLPGMALEVGQVNRAVNHVAVGEPTMIEQVKEIRSIVKCMNEEIKVVHKRIDTLENAIVPASKPDQDPLF